MPAEPTPADALPLQDQLARGVWEAPFRAEDGRSLILWAIDRHGRIVAWRVVPTLADYHGTAAHLRTALDAADPPGPPLRLLK